MTRPSRSLLSRHAESERMPATRVHTAVATGRLSVVIGPLLASLWLLAGCAGAASSDQRATPAQATPPSMPMPPTISPPARPRQPAVSVVTLPDSVQQGALVIGRAPPGSTVTYADREVRVAGDGHFVVGIPRDAEGSVAVQVARPGGTPLQLRIAVQPRDWPIERINGVPPATVNPPAAVARRIAEEQARVSEARSRDDARADFLQSFLRPVEGRISGRFGNQRVYNGTPGAAHSGMDIAAPAGTPVRAPASGVVTFADRDLYLTGGTLVLDHGHGVSSNFLHLSRLDVREGDRVEQGQVIGAVGATGRATGPHLHWGMNWFDVRVDPLLVLERQR